MNINFDPSKQLPRQEKGPIAQLLTVIVGLVALAGAFMFSLVFFAVVAVLVLTFGLYFWWKTRAIRRQIREQMAAQQERNTSAQAEGGPFASRPAEPEAPRAGDVIEGEAVRIDEENR